MLFIRIGGFVFCGSALNNIAIEPFMDFMVECAPTPDSHPLVEGKDLQAEPLSAQVFKTIADPYIGRLSLFRVYTGTFKADSSVYNANKEKEEKVAQISVLVGKEQMAVPELAPGDIAAVAKFSNTATGDTLTVKSNPVLIDPIEFPEPTYSVAITPKSKGDEDKMSGALQRLMEEDPTIRMEKNAETHQSVLTTMGDSHLDIIMEVFQ